MGRIFPGAVNSSAVPPFSRACPEVGTRRHLDAHQWAAKRRHAPAFGQVRGRGCFHSIGGRGTAPGAWRTPDARSPVKIMKEGKARRCPKLGSWTGTRAHSWASEPRRSHKSGQRSDRGHFHKEDQTWQDGPAHRGVAPKNPVAPAPFEPTSGWDTTSRSEPTSPAIHNWHDLN